MVLVVLMVVDAAMVVEGHGPLSDGARSLGGDHRRDGKIRIAWEGKGGRRRKRRRRRRRRKEK